MGASRDSRLRTRARTGATPVDAAADERWSTAGASARLPETGSLDVAQAHAAAFAAGTDPLVVVIGPAGTGKTTMLRAAVESLNAEGRCACGVAPSAAEAEVLGGETGITADTVDKLIAEYSKHGQLPDPRCFLPAGTTVIVDPDSPADAVDLLAEVMQRRWIDEPAISQFVAPTDECVGLEL